MQDTLAAPEINSEPSNSILTPIGYQTGDCGYCKKADQSTSYYASSKRLSVDHYQILVDRGWRRHSCCPHYTIRLPSSQFKARKDQRQAVHRWNRFILGDEYLRELARIHPKSKAEKARSRTDFDLCTAIHEAEYELLPNTSIEPAHKFQVTLEPDSFSAEKFELYSNYQTHVHHDVPEKITPKSFTRFLCQSPLSRRNLRTSDGKDQRLGSFHHCYRLDGRLIAMGVLDLLPHCVSGVYFIYHPDFEKFSLGKISALKETTLALELGYEYYYMGYYIHSCKKMRYKNDYQPQHLLDLETFQWDPIDEYVRKLLDERPYVSVSLAKASAVATTEVNKMDDEKESSDNGAIAELGFSEEKTSDALQDEPPASRRQFFASATEASDAVEGGLSLFDLEFAGMTSAEELIQKVDLDKIPVRIRTGLTVQAEDFVKWSSWSIHDSGVNFSIKGAIAQLAACVGPEIAREMMVSFGE